MKSYELELNLYSPETIVTIKKAGDKYVVSNILNPSRKFFFNTKEEVYSAIGCPRRRGHQFRDLTGENLFSKMRFR